MNNLFIPQFLGSLDSTWVQISDISDSSKEIGKHCQSVAVIPTGQWDITLVTSGLSLLSPSTKPGWTNLRFVGSSPPSKLPRISLYFQTIYNDACSHYKVVPPSYVCWFINHSKDRYLPQTIVIGVTNQLSLVGGLEHFVIFPYIGNFIIPTDELHHFSEG
jgi:hypothetical protein